MSDTNLNEQMKEQLKKEEQELLEKNALRNEFTEKEDDLPENVKEERTKSVKKVLVKDEPLPEQEVDMNVFEKTRQVNQSELSDKTNQALEKIAYSRAMLEVSQPAQITFSALTSEICRTRELLKRK